MKRLQDAKPQRRNANLHTPRGLGALEKSIQADGWIGAITVAADGETFDGSARIEVGTATGFADAVVVDSDGSKPVIVRRIDIATADDPRAVRLGVAANRVAQLDLSWDAGLLAELNQEIDLSGLFAGDELAALLAEARGLPEPGNGGDDFDTTPAEGPTRTALGDLWAIGEHRLLVGDCTDPANVARLMGGERADCVFTSPPYAEQRTRDYGGPSVDGYVEWWQAVQANVRSHLTSNGSFFVNIKPHCDEGERSLYVFDLVIAMRREWDWRFVDEFCWERVGLPGEFNGRFKNAFEPIYHFAAGWPITFNPYAVGHQSENVPIYAYETDMKPIASNAGHVPANRAESRSRARKQQTRRGLALPSNRLPPFSMAGDDVSEHTAAFPVDLPSFFIQAFSNPSDIVYEPFGGSGTVLIAAHRLGRAARVCELLPRYADVILRRAEAEGLTCTLLSH